MKKISFLLTGFLLASIFSCNVFNFDEYKEENNPNAFRAIALTPANLGGNMNRLSFGTSAGNNSNRVGNRKNNEIIVNEDESITLRAHNSNSNAGKIAGSEDGITFYFKQVEADKNFKLRADVEVIFFALQDGRTELNGQEAWGLMARDMVPQYPGKTMEDLKELGNDDYSGTLNSDFWNSYHAGSTGGTSNMIMVGGVKRGARVYWRTGVTDPIGDYITNPATLSDASMAEFNYVPRDNLDYSQWDRIEDRPDFAPAGSRYNLYLEKTNSGFRVIITPPPGRGGDPYYKMNPYDLTVDTVEVGVGTPLEYFIPFPDMLTSIEKDHYYVGLFASRSAEVKISNVHYEEAYVWDCAPRIEMEPDQFTPLLSMFSPNTTSEADYTLHLRSNVEGNIAVTLNGERLPDELGRGIWTTEPDNAVARPFSRFEVPVTNLREGDNIFRIVFYPDQNQSNSNFLLASTNIVSQTFIVSRRSFGDSTENGNIFVAPDGKRTNRGTRESPLDLETAIGHVAPGQKIIMLDGVYTPLHVLIPRGNSGRPNTDSDAPTSPMTSNPNYMDDPFYKYHKVLKAENRDRAVIDFMGHPQNQGFELMGDYWVLSGFHVRGTATPAVKRKGLTIMGNYNRIEWVMTYFNGDSGMQISGLSSEPKILWPSYNVVAYSESFYNRDFAKTDADGFTAKLTVGPGNRFEWCVAHHNVDDGWDLFSKKETGEIGEVTMEYCIAYSNGFELDNMGQTRWSNNLSDWTIGVGNLGGGSGFKLGGEGLAVKHLARHSLSFNNGRDGFTSNSNPALQLEYCTAFDNNAFGENYRGFTVYGSGSNSVMEPVANFGSRQFRLLSMYSPAVLATRNQSNDGVLIREQRRDADGNVIPGQFFSNPVDIGLVWYNNASVSRDFSPHNIDFVVSIELPIPEQTGNAPFENEINAPIKGRFIERDPNTGKFILNDFMRARYVVPLPGATGLY